MRQRIISKYYCAAYRNDPIRENDILEEKSFRVKFVDMS